MRAVHIAGVGMTPFGKSRSALVELLREAAAEALANSKIDEVEAIYITRRHTRTTN